jgi:CRP/FNR family transcriptional regulator, cyclic AMP receptor protein
MMSNTLSQIPLFHSLGETTIKAYDGRVRWARFEENELVVDYDDNSNDVYFLLSGKVRVLYRTITGKEVILAELGSGQFFGELSAIDGVGRSANVTALNRSQMCIISGPIFMELITTNASVCKQILALLASRVRALNTKLAEHSFLQTKHRLYAELIRLSQPRAGHSGQRVLSPPPFHHDLAARIGCRREAVSRELSALEKEGLVAKTRGALALVNPEELNKRISAALAD